MKLINMENMLKTCIKYYTEKGELTKVHQLEDKLKKVQETVLFRIEDSLSLIYTNN